MWCNGNTYWDLSLVNNIRWAKSKQSIALYILSNVLSQESFLSVHTMEYVLVLGSPRRVCMLNF